MLRFILIALILFSASCQKNDSVSHRQTLRINVVGDPQTLDPRKARDLTAVTLIHMFFEGLTRTSKTGQLEMALARDVEISENGMQYLFHLRNSSWSNGDPVTSLDFAESWRAILDPRFPTDMAYQLYPIKNARKAKLGEIALTEVGIQTPDPQTLIIELEQPVPYLLDLLSMPAFFPIPHKRAQANPNWALAPETFVCNGPFFLESWRHSDQIRVAKNDRYWQAKDVRLNGIELFMISNDTEMRMFEDGKLNWAGSPLSTISFDAVRALKASGKLYVSPFSATYFYRVNTASQVKDKKNPLSNPFFRKALAVCLNRQGITEHILQGGHTPAKNLVPPEMGLSEKGYFQDNDKERARSLLTDALLELDLTLANLGPIKVTYSSNDRNAAIAQAAQKQWEEGLGIRVELEAVEPKVFFQKVSRKDYQLAAGSWTADFNDPINFLEVFKYKEASTNHTSWENGKYIDLLSRSTLCRNSEERKGLLREAELILMEQMPIIPIFHFVLNYLRSDEVEGVVLSPLGQIDFRWAYVNPPSSLEEK